MVLEVGTVIEGKVTGITKFGAFVELPGGKTGMVHISEVAATYVREIRDFVTENQTVKVKVLTITPEGRVSLSMKRAIEQAPVGQPQQRVRRVGPGSDADHSRGPSTSSPQTFEDMLNRFKQASDDKMSDIKRNIEGKRGAAKKSHKA
jgi:S1 RNA binding domain protein